MSNQVFEEVKLFINLRLSPLFGQHTDRYLKTLRWLITNGLLQYLLKGTSYTKHKSFYVKLCNLKNRKFWS